MSMCVGDQQGKEWVSVCICMHMCINKIKHAFQRENDKSNEHKHESSRVKLLYKISSCVCAHAGIQRFV